MGIMRAVLIACFTAPTAFCFSGWKVHKGPDSDAELFEADVQAWCAFGAREARSKQVTVSPDGTGEGAIAGLPGLPEGQPGAVFVTEKAHVVTENEKRRWWESNPRWRICNPLP
jgi:hypothetical protein